MGSTYRRSNLTGKEVRWGIGAGVRRDLVDAEHALWMVSAERHEGTPSTLRPHLDVVLEDNGHDDAVDGGGFAEDDADEVLGLDARGHHTAAQNARARDHDSPVPAGQS